MHKYMRAIGFSKDLSRDEQKSLFELILKNPDDVVVWNKRNGVAMSEIEKDVAYNIGVSLRGEGIVGEDFVPEYFFPYIKGTGIKVFNNITVERHAEKESYAGVCEDEHMHLGIIFYLQNAFEYLGSENESVRKKMFNSVSFSGLCVSGKVIMPVAENIKIDNNALAKVKTEMIELAKGGDERVAEAMALEDINEYQQLSKRVMKEDIYSIVEQAFIPYGVECDNYMVIGEIINVTLSENYVTKEKLWVLKVRCRGYDIDICMNKEDLLGEPAVGRRFKGDIWLQGYIDK